MDGVDDTERRLITDGGVERSSDAPGVVDSTARENGNDSRDVTEATAVDDEIPADETGDDPTTRVDGELVAREDLEAELDEIEQRHLRPIGATTEVVEESSTRACDTVAEQTDRTVAMSEELSSVSATIEEIAAEADQVESVTTTAREQTESGQSSAREAADRIQTVESAATTVSEDIEELSDLVDDIGEVVTVIDDIANQTNLLALNANIEAARADTGGDGFAVVAEEVKSLAEESQQRAGEIESQVQAVQRVTDRVVENLAETTDRLREGVTAVDHVVEQFDDIAAAIEEVDSGMSEIAAATDDQAEATESVTATVDEIAERAESVNELIEQIAAANGEQATKIDELNEAVEALREIDSVSGGGGDPDV
ncbi:methyl-accepting chemotaxis protein [Halobaculum sp. MBLA0147]|uniref:methyl-accepting chemotaxis protein n=1 Tax=Halobaculum sp. MBLA0147 TaxID=3079934 RepID=UPI0035233A04